MPCLIGGKKLRVILDTNVFIAAYFNPRSASAKIMDLCSSGCDLLISDRLSREVESILKGIRAERGFLERVRSLFIRASQVKPTERLSVIEEDPDDNKFLECALGGKADYLITSDRHLLKLGDFSGTKICKPTQFLKLHTSLRKPQYRIPRARKLNTKYS